MKMKMHCCISFSVRQVVHPSIYSCTYFCSTLKVFFLACSMMLLIPDYSANIDLTLSEGHRVRHVPGQLDTVKSNTAPLSLLPSKLFVIRRFLAASDLSPMSTSIPSSSGADEFGDEGEGGDDGGRIRHVVAENFTLRSIGESVVVGMGEVASEVDATDAVAAAMAADLAAPNLANNSLCSASKSR